MTTNLMQEAFKKLYLDMKSKTPRDQLKVKINQMKDTPMAKIFLDLWSQDCQSEQRLKRQGVMQ